MISTAFNVNQVAMTQTAAVIIAANPARIAVVIKNIGATNPVFIGPTSGVTATTGHELQPGEAISMDTLAAVYGVCGTGLTTTVSFLEETP